LIAPSRRIFFTFGKSQKLASTLEASEHAPRLPCAGELLTNRRIMEILLTIIQIIPHYS